jgi:predicted nucleotidyltransferase
MVTAIQNNRDMIRIVAERLGPLREQVVFLGGAATAFLITDSAAPDVRFTEDVDVIVEVGSLRDYYNLSELLKGNGFSEAMEDEGAPVCRWIVNGIKVDFMPTEKSILGFSNRWYLSALREASLLNIGQDMTIRMVTAPYFLATKIEAFHGRGKGDFLASHDLEDIIAVLDGRSEVVDEVRSAPRDVSDFLAAEFNAFLSTRDFLDGLPGHLPPDSASQKRVSIVMERLRSIAAA